MATIDCNACDDLRENASEFVTNCVTTNVCNSLKNNTGLGKKKTNEVDMNDAVDCLVGRMAQDVDAYEVCDWKEYMKKFVGNLWNVLKAMLCWIAGFQSQIDRIWCWLNNMTEEKTYSIHVYEDDDPTKPPLHNFRIADGVSMRTGTSAIPINLKVKGEHIRLTGSLSFSGNMPTSYTNGETVPWSYLKHGCDALTNVEGERWGKDGAGCGVLIYELQIKKCDYGFNGLFASLWLRENMGGDFSMRAYFYDKGDSVPPDYSVSSGSQHYTYNPSDPDMMLIQLRLSQTRVSLGNVTPNGQTVVNACKDKWVC